MARGFSEANLIDLKYHRNFSISLENVEPTDCHIINFEMIIILQKVSQKCFVKEGKILEWSGVFFI